MIRICKDFIRSVKATLTTTTQPWNNTALITKSLALTARSHERFHTAISGSIFSPVTNVQVRKHALSTFVGVLVQNVAAELVWTGLYYRCNIITIYHVLYLQIIWYVALYMHQLLLVEPFWPKYHIMSSVKHFCKKEKFNDIFSHTVQLFLFFTVFLDFMALLENVKTLLEIFWRVVRPSKEKLNTWKGLLENSMKPWRNLFKDLELKGLLENHALKVSI